MGVNTSQVIHVGGEMRQVKTGGRLLCHELNPSVIWLLIPSSSSVVEWPPNRDTIYTGESSITYRPQNAMPWAGLPTRKYYCQSPLLRICIYPWRGRKSWHCKGKFIHCSILSGLLERDLVWKGNWLGEWVYGEMEISGIGLLGYIIKWSQCLSVYLSLLSRSLCHFKFVFSSRSLSL